ncbi:MAG: carbohydrate ABC transporter permease [Anaerolineae bacterium]
MEVAARPRPVKRALLNYRVVSQAALHIILTLIALSCFVPFIWLVTASFKTYRELVSSRAIFPKEWTLVNYEQMIGMTNFVQAFINSIYLAVATTLAVELTSVFMGYVFSKYHFPGKELFFTILLSTMMVPFTVVMVPLYLTMANLHLLDSLHGILITSFWSTFGIFMMRQYMESIPGDLIDAARIDGASEFRILFRLVVPLAAAPMGALAVFTFLGSWDSLMWPMIVLRSRDLHTLPLLLNMLRGMWWTRYEIWAAGSMLTVAPVMIIYAFASKYFIRGIAMTGLKA